MTVDVFLDGVAARQRSAAVFDQLRTAIVAGRLTGGDRLPTTRHLADELGIARSTVAAVYARLIAEGYAEGHVGDGTFVTPAAGGMRRTEPAGSRPVATSFDADHDRPWVADLRSGQPDPGLFPLTDWRRSVTSTLQVPPPGYGNPAGLPDLRRAIAAWVGRSRGVEATPDQVLVTAGAQGAFELCARTLTTASDVVAAEDPGYTPARAAFAAHGARITPVPVDRDGIVVERIPVDARAVIVTPSHQSPTGALLTTSRRRQLLAFAADHGTLVLEDDYDTEYRYVDRPLEPLHRLDPSRGTLYIGSFSKTISPSLRLGFLVAPTSIVDRLAEARRPVDTQPPHLTQAALTAFLTSGGFERHLRRTRRVYRARRDLLVDRLGRLLAAGAITSYVPCHAGLHTTVTLPDGVDADETATRLRANGVAIFTTADYQIDHRPSDLVIGFGLATRDQLERALDAIATTLPSASQIS